jgi:hypothetical protein
VFGPLTPVDLMIIAAAREHARGRWAADYRHWNSRED